MNSAKTRRKYRLRDLNITRVDTVHLGANQDAHIVLAKARNTTTTSTRNSTTTRSNAMSSYRNPYMGMSREDIESLVNDAAEETVADGRVETIEEARAGIWEGDPEVYDAYRSAHSDGSRVAKAYGASGDGGHPMTVSEYAHAAIRKKAGLLALQKSNWSATIEDLVVKVLETSEGETVYQNLMANSLVATQPANAFVSSVKKSAAGYDRLSQALDVVYRWSR